LRRSERPAPESAPPLSSIISHPAEVFGIDRSAELAVLRAVDAVVAGAIVVGWVVVWFCAVIVLVVVPGVVACVVAAGGVD